MKERKKRYNSEFPPVFSFLIVKIKDNLINPMRTSSETKTSISSDFQAACLHESSVVIRRIFLFYTLA